MDLEQLKMKFENVRKSGNGFTARCRSHEDKANSIKLSQQPDGKLTLKCYVGCTIFAICSSIGIEVKELYPTDYNYQPKLNVPKYHKPVKQKAETKVEPKIVHWQPICEYLFRNAEGVAVMKKERFNVTYDNGDKSKIFPIKSAQNGKWNKVLDFTQLCLYNLPDVIGSERVFVCEGEKDADNLAKFGFTTTTNIHGALAWHESFNPYLEGKNIVIVIDNDVAGHKRVDLLLSNLVKAKSIKVWNPFDGETIAPKHGKDVSDWLDIRVHEEKTTAETQLEIETIIEAIQVSQEYREPQANEAFLKNYLMKDDGLYHVTYDKDADFGEPKKRETWISSQIELHSWTRDKYSGNWGRYCTFKDSDFIDHKIVLPTQALQGEGSDAINLLSEQGLIVSRKQKTKLLDFLLIADNGKRSTCVISQGWHDNSYVLPDKTFSTEKVELVLQNTDSINTKFKTAGTLEQWQKNISKYAKGNSRLTFAIAVAFASALLPLANEPNGGFHLRGDTSTGKSTALYVGGSVWGGDNQKGFLETWKATVNGFEIVAQNHNHALLLLDEIQQVNAREVGDIIYTLANGFGKARMTKSITARQKMEWNLLFLSSGEMSLASLLVQGNDRIFGGQEARFVDIEAKPENGFGLFETLHEFANGADFSTFLRSSSCKYYGTAIREFIDKVVKNRKFVETYIIEVQQEMSKKVYEIDPNAAGEISRVAMRFALVAAAGELATEFEITGWEKGESLKTIEAMFNDWLVKRGGTGNFDLQQGVENAIAFIQSNQHRFGDDENEERIVQNLLGFKDRKIFGETVYCIFTQNFKTEVCKGFDYLQIAKELSNRGYLIKAKSGELTRKQRLRNWKDGSPQNFYIVSLQDGNDRGFEITS